MIQFLAVFIQASEAAGLELAIFFNGALETPRHSEWIQNQLNARLKVNNVSFYYYQYNKNKFVSYLS